MVLINIKRVNECKHLCHQQIDQVRKNHVYDKEMQS